MILSEAHRGNRWTVWCYFWAARRRRRRRRPRRVECRNTKEWWRLCWIALTAETRQAGFQRLSVVLPARPLLSNWCFQSQMSETSHHEADGHTALWHVCSQLASALRKRRQKGWEMTPWIVYSLLPVWHQLNLQILPDPQVVSYHNWLFIQASLKSTKVHLNSSGNPKIIYFGMWI